MSRRDELATAGLRRGAERFVLECTCGYTRTTLPTTQSRADASLLVHTGRHGDRPHKSFVTPERDYVQGMNPVPLPSPSGGGSARA